MLYSESVRLLSCRRRASRGNLRFENLTVNILRRFHGLMPMMNSLGQTLFAVGCLLVVFLARHVNQIFRNRILS